MQTTLDAVLDASPLIYLARMGAIDLACRVLGTLYIPPGVEREAISAGMRKGAEDALRLSVALERGTIEVVDLSSSERSDAARLASVWSLGRGEAEVLAVAAAQGGRAFVEERRARRVAGEGAIQTIKTIDVLILALLWRRADLSEAVEALRGLAVTTNMTPATLFEHEFVLTEIAKR